MEIISYEYTKQRREFGLHPQFGDSAPKLESLQSNEEEAKQWLTSGQQRQQQKAETGEENTTIPSQHRTSSCDRRRNG